MQKTDKTQSFSALWEFDTAQIPQFYSSHK